MAKKIQRVIFTELEALRYLAQIVEECINEGFAVSIFTGEEGVLGGGMKPDKHHARQLAIMLDTLKMSEAAAKVRNDAGLEDVK